MKERDVIDAIERALEGRRPEQVPMTELEAKLPMADPLVAKVMEVYRASMADGPLLALTIIARRKERRGTAESIMMRPKNDDTIIVDPKRPEEA